MTSIVYKLGGIANVENNGNDYGEELKAIDVSGLYTNEGVSITGAEEQGMASQGVPEYNNGMYVQENSAQYEHMTVQELEQGLNLDDDEPIIQEFDFNANMSVDNGLDLGNDIQINGGLDGEILVNQSEQEVSAFSERAELSRKKKKIKKHFRKDDDLVSDIKEEELPIIEMYRVYKSYQPGVDAVKNINFRIKKGEFVFIVGHSGSGKTTLMNLMMNAIRPSSGRVYVNGYELTRLHKRKIAKFRRGIGVVFQDFKLLNDRDVFENVAFAQRVIEKTTRQVNKNVPEVLSLVGLTHKQKALPTELSGGKQQRVAIARALVNQPTILLADEPTGNLDPKTAWEIMDLLEEINKRGTTVIVVTHNLEVVEAMKKRVITIDKGNLVEDGIKE